MARLEQYTFKTLTCALEVGTRGRVELTDEDGNESVREIHVEYVDRQGRLLRVTGGIGSSAHFVIKMSTLSEGGFLTIAYPD